MKTRLLILVVLVLLVGLVVAGSCVRRLLGPEPVGIWTPAPVSGAPIVATRPAEILPTLAPITPAQPVAPTPAPVAEATADPKQIVITEADVLRVVASGVAAQNGVTVDGLAVRFADEKMTLQAASLSYSGITVQNLVLVGRLVAVDGKLQLETESIAPRSLVTALIPTFANQALGQFAAQWYVEEVRVLDGRLELRIR